ALLDETGKAIQAIGRRFAAHACDLREPGAAQTAIDAALEAFGRLDVVVHSAGATKRGDFFDLTDADFEDGFALKFMGAVRLTRAAWPHLMKSAGAMVSIIGMGGRNASPDFTIGGPVNAALMNFTKAISIRGIRDGVRVMGINPGLIETDRFRRRVAAHAATHGCTEDEARRTLLGEHGIARVGKPEEIGKLVCYLAGTPGTYMQGSLVQVDGGEFHGV
ncbi:MAG TPA: SDR family oxidoreductase, partial [Hyphomicrobiaceae bacterium]|nr:SDR family oxidoreductase [Hyphomicrobiaceae bacterium]